MKILINVANKIATAADNYTIVCGNSDYVVSFTFDEEWQAHTVKTARFSIVQQGMKKNIDVVFEGNECNMPVLSNTHIVEIGVFAGDLRTTTPCMLLCLKSILCEGGTPEEPAEEVYNQIIELCNKAVESAKNTEVFCENAETLCEQAKILCQDAKTLGENAKELAEDIPVVEKNTNTIVAKNGNNTVDENSNDALIAGNDNILKNGTNTLIIGHENDIDGESNLVGGSNIKVRGIHNCIVGSRLNVAGNIQAIFGCGDEKLIPADIAIAYYDGSKKVFAVKKDGTFILNNEKFISLPECSAIRGDYVLESNAITNTYGIECLRTRGGTQYCYRLVVSQKQVPEVSADWVGLDIQWVHEEGADPSKWVIETATIRSVVKRTDNNTEWNIDFDRIISHFNTDEEAREYWHSFIIKGVNYKWKSKTQLFEEFKQYIGG